jgi:hypothetical protein
LRAPAPGRLTRAEGLAPLLAEMASIAHIVSLATAVIRAEAKSAILPMVELAFLTATSVETK